MAHLSAIDAVTETIVDALNVSAMKSTLATNGVYAHVPQGTDPPYVRVDSPVETRMDTMGKAGKTVSLNVHAFSDYKGPTKAAQMISKAVELLHYQSLSVAGHTTVAVQYDGGTDAGDEIVNGKTVYHYVGTFNVTVQQS